MNVVVASGIVGALLARQHVSSILYRRKVAAAKRSRLEASQKIILNVEGMMCQMNCGANVQRALERTDGVLKAQVSFKDKNAVVCVEKNVRAEDLVAVVEGIGFEATIDNKPSLESSQEQGPVTTVSIKVKGLQEEHNAKEILNDLPGVTEISISLPKQMVVVLIRQPGGVTPERLAMALHQSGLEATVHKVFAPQMRNGIRYGASRASDTMRHACIKGVINQEELDQASKGVLKSYHEQQLEEYSRYKNWTQSCYMECHEQWSPQVPVTEPLRDCMRPLLDKAKASFAEWYCKLHGLDEVEVITLNSFITKYLPVQGKAHFGKHVDSAKADGSLILALPTDQPHDWPGLIVWDGPKDEDGKQAEHIHVLQPGDICCLDSLVWHHGLPITKGARYVAVCFYRCKWKKIKARPTKPLK